MRDPITFSGLGLWQHPGISGGGTSPSAPALVTSPEPPSARVRAELGGTARCRHRSTHHHPPPAPRQPPKAGRHPRRLQNDGLNGAGIFLRQRWEPHAQASAGSEGSKGPPHPRAGGVTGPPGPDEGPPHLHSLRGPAQPQSRVWGGAELVAAGGGGGTGSLPRGVCGVPGPWQLGGGEATVPFSPQCRPPRCFRQLRAPNPFPGAGGAIPTQAQPPRHLPVIRGTNPLIVPSSPRGGSVSIISLCPSSPPPCPFALLLPRQHRAKDRHPGSRPPLPGLCCAVVPGEPAPPLVSAGVLVLLGESGGAGNPRSSWSSFHPPAQVLLPTPGCPMPNPLPAAWGRVSVSVSPSWGRQEPPARFAPALVETPMWDHPPGMAAAPALGEAGKTGMRQVMLGGVPGIPKGKKRGGRRHGAGGSGQEPQKGPGFLGAHPRQGWCWGFLVGRG